MGTPATEMKLKDSRGRASSSWTGIQIVDSKNTHERRICTLRIHVLCKETCSIHRQTGIGGNCHQRRYKCPSLMCQSAKYKYKIILDTFGKWNSKKVMFFIFLLLEDGLATPSAPNASANFSAL